MRGVRVREVARAAAARVARAHRRGERLAHRLDQHHEQRVLRGAREREVEVEIVPEVGGPSDRGAHLPGEPREHGDVGRGAAPRREPGDRDLDRPAQLEHLVDGELAGGHRVREEAVERRAAELAHHRAPAVRHLDQPGGDELPASLADDPARDAEAARVLDLARQPVAGPEAAGDDLGADLRGDSFRERSGRRPRRARRLSSSRRRP